MQLSEAGRIVDEEWRRAEEVRPFVQLDEFVVMPNHVHGIVILGDDVAGETSHRLVSTGTPGSVRGPLKPGTLSSIVGQFKSVCTKRIWATGRHDFAWQPRFYDHVIRNDESLAMIREYIRGNPAKWETDEYYVKTP